MADINIKDLRPAGVELFADAEGYMSDLTEDELSVWGGTGDSHSGGGSVATVSFASDASINSVLSLSAASKPKSKY